MTKEGRVYVGLTMSRGLEPVTIKVGAVVAGSGDGTGPVAESLHLDPHRAEGES